MAASKNESAELLLRVLQRAQQGDKQAQAAVEQHRDQFKKNLPILEAYLRGQANTQSVKEDPKYAPGYKAGAGVEDAVKAMRSLIDPNADEDEQMTVEYVPPAKPKPESMPRMQVKSQFAAKEPTPAREPMPNTVKDSYGRVIDSPAQQLPPSEDVQENARRVREGYDQDAQVQQSYARAKAATPSVMEELVKAGKPASGDQELARALLQTMMTLNGKPVK